MGYKTFEIVFKQPSTDTGTITINNASIENHFYKLQLNPDKGTIQSLYDKELNCELVDSSSPWELGAFIYEKLGNRDQLAQYRLDDYNRTGLSECRIIDSSNGPIYQRILLQGKSPGTDEAFGVNLEIKLYHDTKRIELEYAIKRLPETDPQGYTLLFLPTARRKTGIRRSGRNSYIWQESTGRDIYRLEYCSKLCIGTK